MKTITFGNALKINYQRLTGPRTGEEHLPVNRDSRIFKELELEDDFNRNIPDWANIPAKRPIQVIENKGTAYLIANGPQTNTLDRYESIKNTLPQPQSIQEAVQRADVFEALLEQEGLLKDAPEITLKYTVQKNRRSGLVFPNVTNFGDLRKLIRQTFQQ